MNRTLHGIASRAQSKSCDVAVRAAESGRVPVAWRKQCMMTLVSPGPFLSLQGAEKLTPS